MHLVLYPAAFGLGFTLGLKLTPRAVRVLLLAIAFAASTYAWLGFAAMAAPSATNWIALVSVCFGVFLVGAVITAAAPRRPVGRVALIGGLIPPFLVSLINFGLVTILVPATFLALIAVPLGMALAAKAPHTSHLSRPSNRRWCIAKPLTHWRFG